MDNFIINGFYAYQQIGKGSFGMVYKGIKNGTLYAIKRLKKGQNAENNLKNEIGILKVLKHRNIINFVEAITSTNHHACRKSPNNFLDQSFRSNIYCACKSSRALCF